jgi:hypothetical protein
VSEVVPPSALQRRTPRSLVTIGVLVLCLGAASVTACGGWVPARDYVAESKAGGATAYQKVLLLLDQKGYSVVEKRDADRYVRVRAHIDEKSKSHPSFIEVEVEPSGNVRLTPSGYLVKNGKVHHALASETTKLETATRDALASEPPAPAPLPPPESATASAAPAAPAAPPPAPPSTLPTVTKAVTSTAPAHAKPKPAPSPAPAPKSSGTSKPANDDWVTVP